MREFPPRPALVTRAAEESRGHHPALEVLIFIALFIVCSIAQSIVSTIPMVVLILNSGFLSAAMSGDLNQMMECMMELMRNPAYLLISLFLTTVTIAGVLVFCRLLERRSFASMGLVRCGAGREYLVGWGIGAGMLTISMLPALLAGDIRIIRAGEIPWLLMILFFVGYLFQGMSEELLCRGYFCISLARRCKMQWAVLISSLAFAMLHLLNSGLTLLAMLNLTLYGVFAALWLIRRGSIWGIAAMHSAWNYAQGNLWGFQVSGFEMNASLFTVEQTSERALLSGGSFGLEGGLGVTLVLGVGIALLCMMKNKNTYQKDEVTS